MGIAQLPQNVRNSQWVQYQVMLDLFATTYFEAIFQILQVQMISLKQYRHSIKFNNAQIEAMKLSANVTDISRSQVYLTPQKFGNTRFTKLGTYFYSYDPFKRRRGHPLFQAPIYACNASSANLCSKIRRRISVNCQSQSASWRSWMLRRNKDSSSDVWKQLAFENWIQLRRLTEFVQNNSFQLMHFIGHQLLIKRDNGLGLWTITTAIKVCY